jgi:hypothetical protein
MISNRSDQDPMIHNVDAVPADAVPAESIDLLLESVDSERTDDIRLTIQNHSEQRLEVGSSLIEGRLPGEQRFKAGCDGKCRGVNVGLKLAGSVVVIQAAGEVSKFFGFGRGNGKVAGVAADHAQSVDQATKEDVVAVQRIELFVSEQTVFMESGQRVGCSGLSEFRLRMSVCDL